MRYTSTLLAFAIGETLAVLNPTSNVNAAPVKEAELQKRGRTGDTFCYGTYNSIFNAWGVKSRTNTIGLRDGGASGFLDQLRGHCGAITNYQVHYQADDDEVHWAVIYFFNTSVFCGGGDIAAAARDAGGPELDCELETE
ncbi:hypothetical protein CF326_g3355 [Tilletia indica]|nr:hypothetical protein CF326_g3355 [Tilletia indica]